MAFGFNKQRLSPIGIDFGADSVKLLQVVADDPPQLIAAGAVTIPESARFDAAARQAFVAEALKQLLRKEPIKGRRAVLSFPAFQTLMQHIEVGKGDGESVDELVNHQLRARLAIEPTRMLVRHFPVRQFVRDGVGLQEVICLAASRDVIHGYIDLAHRCKLDVVGMHAEPTAVLKAFEHLFRSASDAQRVTCFIDIGAAMTKVIIAHGPKLMFAKSIHVGGDHLTRQLAHAQSLSFDEAYRARRAEAGGAGAPAAAPVPEPVAVGVAVAGEDGAGGSTGIPSLDAQPAPRRGGGRQASAGEPVETIIDELRLCLRYHAGLFPDKPVEKLVFLGGEARHVKTCQTIAKAVRIAAQLGDPFARMSRIGIDKQPTGLDLGAPQPGWAVPVGLCLSEPAA